MRKLLTILCWLIASAASAQTVYNPADVAPACAYSTSPAAPTTGMFYRVQCDVTGAVKTTSNSSGSITNPTSTLTRPSDTTAYAANDLIASSTTAGSIVVPSFSIANSAGGAIIPRLRLSTSATTGWGTTLTLTLWSAAPTYTNGDNGAYAVATGGATRLASYSCSLTQYGDAASGSCAITVGNALVLKLASGTAVYWDLQATAAVTPISAQTFTVTAETLN